MLSTRQPQPREAKAKKARSKAGNYARAEYGATAKELAAFTARVDAEIEDERRAGTIVPYTGDLAALVRDAQVEPASKRPAKPKRAKGKK